MERDEEELFLSWSKNFKDYLYREYNKKDHRLARCDMSGRDILKMLDAYGDTIIRSFAKLSKDSRLNKEEEEIFTELKLFAIRTLEVLKPESDIEILNASYNIGISKNHDYGSANITNFGVLGVLVRLNDKVQRVKTLLASAEIRKIKNLKGGSGMMVHDEKIEDTLMDMINYATYGKMQLDGVWFQ